MDYPLYEELRRRKHPAAKWWLVGDRLYYLGLIPGMMAIAAVPVAVLASLIREWPWAVVWMCLVAFALAVPTFLVGAALKDYSYRAAERDGITWP